MDVEPGAEFAGFKIVRRLGAGGMGEVYLVDHPRLPRQEALKVLAESYAANDEYRQRFQREAELAASLWHPHLVALHDRGEAEGRLWISMDYVDGSDAGQIVRTKYPAGMPISDAAEIIAAVASALDYAHERGMLHRDVKPSNILYSDGRSGNRRIALADFGIAREISDVGGLTAANLTVGTVEYAAPEQLMGKPLDGRADQYALAATAFHLLTGTAPFGGSNPVAVVSQRLTAAPPRLSSFRPDLALLDDVFARALATEPDERYPNCADFAAEFQIDSLATSDTSPTASRTVVSAEEIVAASAPTMAAPIPLPRASASTRSRSLPSPARRTIRLVDSPAFLVSAVAVVAIWVVFVMLALAGTLEGLIAFFW